MTGAKPQIYPIEFDYISRLPCPSNQTYPEATRKLVARSKGGRH
jgi:hypothetical protein